MDKPPPWMSPVSTRDPREKEDALAMLKTHTHTPQVTQSRVNHET